MPSRSQNVDLASPLAFHRSTSRRQCVTRWARAVGVLSPSSGYVVFAIASSSHISRWRSFACAQAVDNMGSTGRTRNDQGGRFIQSHPGAVLDLIEGCLGDL